MSVQTLPLKRPKAPKIIARQEDVISVREFRKRARQGENMGLVYADIELINSDDLAFFRRGAIAEDKIKRVTITALVDSGAEMLCINEQIKQKLDLPTLEKYTAQLADESEIEVEVVGPIDVIFENRSTTVRALVMPQDAEVLLGAIPMEGMDVVIELKAERLVVNPKNPYIPSKYVK